MDNGTKSKQSSEARNMKKPYTSPKVRSYGNIHDITLASSDRTQRNYDGNAPAMPAKTA